MPPGLILLLGSGGLFTEDTMGQVIIKINGKDHIITSDETQWMIGEPLGIDKRTGERRIAWVGYYSSIEALMLSLMEKKVRTSDYNSLHDIAENVKKVRDELTGIYHVDFNK